MPVAVVVATAVFAIPTLWLGVGKIAPPLRWEQRRHGLRRSEAVDRLVLIALRGGLLLLLLLLALVALVGGVAALRADVTLPNGVVVACVAAVALSILILATFARPRR